MPDIVPIDDAELADWAAGFEAAIAAAVAAVVGEVADELSGSRVLRAALVAAAPEDAERARPRWRDRVRAGADALLGWAFRLFGRTAERVREQAVAQVLDTVEPPPGAPPDWRERITAGPMAAPLVSPRDAEPVMEATAQALDALGQDVTTWIRDQIAEGLAAGEGVDQLAARLRSGAHEVGRVAAARIARTETTRAVNAAALAEAKALGLSGTKTWASHHDERVRPAHLAADEETVDLDARFLVGGFPMLYPGDPAAPPALRINCRCVMHLTITPGALPGWAQNLTPGADSSAPHGPTEWPEFTGWDDYTGGVTAAMANDDTTDDFQSRMPDQLKRYWLHGEGALKIRWGTPGAFDRCVRALRDDFPQNPEGLCANLYHEATGRWPGEHRDEDSAGVLTAAAEVHTGAMIALVPSEADVQRLVVDGGEPADQLHLTVLYLGEAAAIPEEARANLVAELQAWADGDGEVVEAHGFAVNVFNPGSDEPCVVLGVGGDDLAEAGQRIRAVAENVLGMDGVEIPDNHTPWVPHVTLAYLPDASPEEIGVRVAELTGRVGPISFDRIRVAYAGEVTDIPLRADGDDEAEEPDGEDEVTASALVELAAPQAPPGAWEGILTVEGHPTGDGREFATGALTAAPLPHPLMWQRVSDDGHRGSVVVGRIDEVWRDGAQVWGRGVFNLALPDALQALDDVAQGFSRGISVDVDDISEADVEFVWAEMVDEYGDLVPFLDRRVFRRGRLRGATLVSIPAFAEAGIQLGWTRTPTTDRLEGNPMADVAALAACACETGAPPREWFDDPGFTGPAPLTVTDDGRVYGHAALWGTCHVGIQGQCVTPPREGVHAHYRLGEVLCSDGSTVATGHITIGTGHASTIGITAQAAVEHYDNTGTAVADVASGEDAFGIWVAGALRPGVDPARVRELRAAQLSGDWRRVGGKLRLVAMLAVNVPGFPVPRLATASSEGRQVAMVASGIVPERAVLDLRVDELARRIRRVDDDSSERVAALAARIRR